MNAIFFGLKRAFHSSLRVGRPLLTSLGLTAARFDLLYAIRQEMSCRILQSRLRRVLGVTAPTVSRMVTSLAALGLVKRTRSMFDKRQRYVELTTEGLASLDHAVTEAIETGIVHLAVDSALAGDKWHDDDGTCLLEMDIAESVLRRIRRAFLDAACVQYLWHPDS